MLTPTVSHEAERCLASANGLVLTTMKMVVQ